MAYLVDGHNLIPKLPGMSLRSIDDEEQLISLLQVFCRQKRKHVEVFFDQAPTGSQPVRKNGWVTAHFVRRGQTADESIRLRLVRLGKAAANWTVISSDRQVQVNARALHAQVVSAKAFAMQLEQALQDEESSTDSKNGLPPKEVQAWMDLFRSRKP